MKKRTKGFQFNTYLQITSLSLFLTFFLTLLSFHRIPPPNNAFDYKSSFPTIIDTLNVPTLYRTRKWISVADYDILYLGYEKDSIFVQHNDSIYKKNTRYYDAYDKYKGYHEAKIQLEIDLSQEIKEDTGMEWDEMSNNIFNTDSEYYKSYPVIIKNHGKKPIIIGYTGYGEQLPLILEAKDQHGEWKAIEEQPMYSCGFGINPIILKPQEIIVTGVKIYQGSFETELRLGFKYGNIYSKPFKGSIHPNQFKSIFQDGEFNEEYLESEK